MKKQILLFILMLLPMIASADAVEINGIYYILTNSSRFKTAKVTSHPNKYKGDVVIPETVTYEGVTYDVNNIGYQAFQNNFDLTSVTIPNSITTIESYAFLGCNKLTSIVIPNSVTKIAREAFKHCRKLNSVTIGKSVTEIGVWAFDDCIELTAVNITDLSAWCKIVFGENVINNSNPLAFAHHLFLNGQEIINLVIPSDINYINGYAFENCSGLKSLTIPNSVTTIYEGAFKGCNGLTSVNFEEGIITIGTMAFSGCSSLTNITIPNSVTTIRSNCFSGCSSLTTINIGKDVKDIYSYAFFRCYEMTDLYCYAEKLPNTGENIFEESYIEYATLHVPESSIDSYKNTDPWKGFGKIKAIGEAPSIYKLTYMVDGVIYKTYDFQEGASITPEAEPTKEGYTFSGWSGLPSTMPSQDVTVTGTFTINKYKLTYVVDGSEYRSIEIEYGATITPEAAPTKDGYSFSGWSEIPSTMPANNVTVAGTFTVNKYKLTYVVDGSEYRSYEIEYGTTITPEAAPTKDGYSFSGWSEIPSTMPARNITITGSFTYVPPTAYTLKYVVDGQVYKTDNYYEGDAITPETEPTKEGYTFSGWSYVPSTMPAEDVTVTGSFTVNTYTLTYKVDGEVYKTYEIEYGARIIPEAEPTKEGYSFSGWSEIPQTMPAHDITVTGSFTYAPPKAYTLTYMVDGEVYKTVSYYAGDAITPEAEPTKDGYTFSGWSEIPAKMPAHDVEVTGTFNYILIEGTVHDIAVCNNNYVLCFDDWDNNGTNRCGKGVLFGDGFFLDVSGGAVATNKGTVNLSVVNSDDDNHVTQYIADRYGSDYPNDHFNSWRLKNQQDIIAMKVTAHSKLIFFLQGNNKSGVNARIPKIFDGSRDIDSIYEDEALNDAPDAGFPSTSSGFRYEWIAPKDMLIYIGSYNGDMFLSYLIVETNESSQLSKYHTLSYYVDGKVYRTYVLTENKTINPEAAPTKDGYSFSGWSGLPQTMPDHDVIVTGSFTKGAYKLIYKLDGEVYKTDNYYEGDAITPEAEPTKEGYTFSGWSGLPSTMPAQDVTVTGTFTVNKYKLIYKVDGEVYKTYDIEYGTTITPEAEPTKEGYKFSGWSYTPSKMPAEDVTVVGTFTQEAFVKDNVTYEMNGNDASVTHADNAKGEIVVEASVVINGKSYNVTSIADGAFQGCTGLTSIEIPATVTRIGENAFNGCSELIVIKIGKDIKEIGSKAFANIGKSNARTRADIELRVYCEAEVLPSTAGDAFENSPIDKGTLYVNDDLIGVYKVVMPWNGFGTIVGLSTGIRSVSIDSEDAWIFDMQGNRIDNVRKGVNIIRTRDGKTKKIVVK